MRIGGIRFLCAAILGAAGCDQVHPQSPACARFVACVGALDAQRGRHTNVVRFTEGGPCWTAEEAGATLCTAACERGLPLLARGAAPIPEACR